MRITRHEIVRDEAVPYATERIQDPSLFTGTEVVTRQGEQGTRRLTYTVRAVNGVRQKPRQISEKIVRAPVTERISVGTKQRPASVAGADGLDWAGLAACESGGGRTRSTPRGRTEGSTSSTPAPGGPSAAADARRTRRRGADDAGEEALRAKGASPWPHCGRRLHG